MTSASPSWHFPTGRSSASELFAGAVPVFTTGRRRSPRRSRPVAAGPHGGSRRSAARPLAASTIRAMAHQAGGGPGFPPGGDGIPPGATAGHAGPEEGTRSQPARRPGVPARPRSRHPAPGSDDLLGGMGDRCGGDLAGGRRRRDRREGIRLRRHRPVRLDGSLYFRVRPVRERPHEEASRAGERPIRESPRGCGGRGRCGRNRGRSLGVCGALAAGQDGLGTSGGLRSARMEIRSERPTSR